MNSLELTVTLTPGFRLSPLKCRTAWFTGCDGRLALLLSKYIESSLSSRQTACKYTKYTKRHKQLSEIYGILENKLEWAELLLSRNQCVRCVCLIIWKDISQWIEFHCCQNIKPKMDRVRVTWGGSLSTLHRG